MNSAAATGSAQVPSRSTGASSPPRGPARWIGLLAFAGTVAAAAAVGGLAAAGSQETYAALDLPFFAPPAWLFGPAWTVLYILIALAGWLVWLREGISRAIGIWLLQLALNAAWTPLFFGAGLYWVAFAEIALLWAMIILTVSLFATRRRLAAVLMVPYLGWVTFAGALNLAIALAN